MITNEILNSIDEVSDITLESMIDVYVSLCNEYVKGMEIENECVNVEHIQEYAIFQEAKAPEKKEVTFKGEMEKMGEGQGKLMRILSFLPRAIIALFRVIKNKLKKPEAAQQEAKTFTVKMKSVPAEEKEKLFNNIDPKVKKGALVSILAALGITGGAVAGKKIHDKIKNKNTDTEDEETKEKETSESESSEETKEEAKTEPEEKKGEDTSEEKAPPKVQKAINALENLEEFYKKYKSTGEFRHSSPITYEDGTIYVQEGVSAIVDDLMEAVNNLEIALNGGKTKKFRHRYDRHDYNALFKKSTPETAASDVLAAYKKFISNEAGLLNTVNKANTRTGDLTKMDPIQAKEFKKNEDNVLIAKIAQYIVTECKFFYDNLELWNRTVEAITYVNDCYTVEGKDDKEYKSDPGQKIINNATAGKK